LREWLTFYNPVFFILEEMYFMIGKTIFYYPPKADPPPADKILEICKDADEGLSEPVEAEVRFGR
jgi:hypothetical protein